MMITPMKLIPSANLTMLIGEPFRGLVSCDIGFLLALPPKPKEALVLA